MRSVLACLVSSALMISTAAVADDTLPTPAVSPRLLTIVDTEAGLVLADQSDMTAYTFDNDTAGQSNCNGQCAIVWPPILTTKDTLSAPFGVTIRANGDRQVTFNGSPLYLYKNDAAPGDIKGDGVGGIWHLARLQ